MHISRQFTIEDWNFGRCTDIDIAEDQLTGWIFGPASALADQPDAGIAILMLVTPCFGIIHAYHSGELRRGPDDASLAAGLALVFPGSSPAAREKYIREVRQGFMQGSIFRRTVVHHDNPSFPTSNCCPMARRLASIPGTSSGGRKSTAARISPRSATARTE